MLSADFLSRKGLGEFVESILKKPMKCQTSIQILLISFSKEGNAERKAQRNMRKGNYQIEHKSSPPIWSARAFLSVKIPWEVDRTTTPNPPRTFGMSFARVYIRTPGLLRIFTSVKHAVFPIYFSSRISWRLFTVISWINPSARRICARFRVIFVLQTSTKGCFARLAFLIRTTISLSTWFIIFFSLKILKDPNWNPQWGSSDHPTITKLGTAMLDSRSSKICRRHSNPKSFLSHYATQVPIR